MRKLKIYSILAAIVFIVITGCSINKADAPKADGQLKREMKGSKPNDQIATTSEKLTLPKEEIKYLKNGGIDTSDWKIFTDEKMNFEIKYPEEWEIKKLTDPKAGFVLRSNNYKPLTEGSVGYEGEIFINKISNPNNLEIINLIKTFDDTSRFWPIKFKYSEKLNNDHEQVIFDLINEGKYGRKEVFIRGKKEVFILEYLFEAKDKDIEKIFDQIINNFKIVK
jgi:hypothetical protein